METIRYDRIKQYCRLFEERKRSRAKRAELTRKIEVIEKELNQAWRQLDLHRRRHTPASADA
jgi:HPt (histidine-containing phosphotransfer) domain-containing protein